MAKVTEQVAADEAAKFELYATSAFGRIGARANYWLSLQDSAARYGIKPEAVIGAELTAANRAADEGAYKVGRAIVALADGRAVLVAYVKDGKLLFGVRPTNGGDTLDGWPLIVLGAAALVGAFYLIDGWLEVRKADALAEQLRADTAHKSAIQMEQATDPRVKAALAQAAADATAAAAGGGTTWVDELAKGLGIAAGAAGTAGLAWLAALWLLGRSRGSRKGSRA